MLPSDLFVPQRVGDVAIAINYAKLSLLTSGYIRDAAEVGAYESGGNTITFPKWTSDGDLGAQTMTDGNAVTADKMTASSDTESLISKIIAFEWTLAAMEDALRGKDKASVSARLGEVVAQKSRKAIQDSILTEAATTSLSFDEATDGDGYTSYRGILRAAIENWGEKAWDEVPLLVMHSKCVFDLLNTEEVKKSQVYGGTPSVENGKIMAIAGKLVMPLDSIDTDGSGADTTYNNLIIRKNALLYWPKRELTYQELPQKNSDAWDTWWTFRYGVHLAADLPLGVIKYVCKSSLDL